MNKTRTTNRKDYIAVDIKNLSALLSCGETSAKKIAEEAEARINIGRRVLYSVDKVRNYVNSIAI